jgi:replicative DNA helicase
MRAKARRLKLQKDIGLVVVDYLQLMESSRRSESRQQEITEISRSLKALAKELNVPVIALSQLSRAPEQRTSDQRPRLSDLRESGAIEQDADLVLFLYKEKPPEDKKPELGAGTVEVIVGKNRNGPTDKILLTWLGNFMRFEDYDPRFATV